MRASGPPCAPRNETSAPLSRSSSATARAGTTCPAVPPAAITTLGTSRGAPSSGGARAGASLSTAVDDPQSRSAAPPTRGGGGRPAPRDVEQEPGRGEHHQQARVAVRDEGKRHARERREAHDREEVDDRLNQDHGREPGGEQLRVAVAGSLGGPQPGVAEEPEETEERPDSHESELLLD